jgi:hypothetical protein
VATRRLLVGSNFLALLTVGFTKLSVLALYLRLAPPTYYRKIIYGVMALTAIWILVTGILVFVLCVPLHAYWDVRYTGPQTCLPEVPFYVAFSSIDLALDTIIYFLPFPVVLRLQMPLRQRFIVAGVFGLGIL